ncbi:hypothetical protein K1T71_002333 [Dendrolimus kikuchii]|uniref:Uncharacterized protein n=1 Tax=Dendrolimus kikuchii TaxID=765133 RepID=A0ACC1DCS3_9NEOP|nr:hypothetical protein K1T71_002333 [Dendrolimus kikuchii]
MANEATKTQSDSVVDNPPIKRIKLDSDTSSSGGKRTVATMCGAWRRDEVDGGLIFVFPKRDLGLSPDPIKEVDYPENIQDFWDGTWQASDNVQSMGPNHCRRHGSGWHGSNLVCCLQASLWAGDSWSPRRLSVT